MRFKNLTLLLMLFTLTQIAAAPQLAILSELVILL